MNKPSSQSAARCGLAAGGRPRPRTSASPPRTRARSSTTSAPPWRMPRTRRASTPPSSPRPARTSSSRSSTSGGIEFGVANLQEVELRDRGPASGGRATPDPEPPDRRPDHAADRGDLRARRQRHHDDRRPQGPADDRRLHRAETILPQLDAIYATAGMTRDDIDAGLGGLGGRGGRRLHGGRHGRLHLRPRRGQGARGRRRGGRPAGADRSSTTDANLALAARALADGVLHPSSRPAPCRASLEDAVYIAFPQVVFTHANAPEDVVYAMAKAHLREQGDVWREHLPAV